MSGKPDRSSSSSPSGRRLVRRGAAMALLAALLLAASPPAAGQIRISFSLPERSSSTAKVAAALAKAVQQVQSRFDLARRALPVVSSPDGKPAHPRAAVMDLIAATGTDLGQAIERVGDPGLDGLRFWATEELLRVRKDLERTVRVAASSPCPCPRAVAVVAGAGSYPLPGIAQASAESGEPATISAETSSQALESVARTIGRLFLLARNDDLEVELWVGSTPAQRAIFRFWSQATLKGKPPEPGIIRTNGKRERVRRGLYAYRAEFTRGRVVESLASGGPVQASAPAQPAGWSGQSVNRNERLDLVDGTRFFCCRFDEKLCHHVDRANECRP